jgi:hypothetical protein
MHIFAHFTLCSKCYAAVCSIVLATYGSQRQLQFYKGFINLVDIKVEPAKKVFTIKAPSWTWHSKTDFKAFIPDVSILQRQDSYYDLVMTRYSAGTITLEEHIASIFYPEDGGSIFFPEGWYPTRLYDVITQKIWFKNRSEHFTVRKNYNCNEIFSVKKVNKTVF